MSADELRQAVRSGLDDGDFTALYLWIRFWSNGGNACRLDMDAFVYGSQGLSDSDVLVLASLVHEL